MSTVRMNPSSIALGSRFTEWWNKLTSVCFGSSETEEIQANEQPIPLANVHLQHLIDNLIQINTIYEPAVAESISKEEIRKIEEIVGKLTGH